MLVPIEIYISVENNITEPILINGDYIISIESGYNRYTKPEYQQVGIITMINNHEYLIPNKLYSALFDKWQKQAYLDMP